MHTAECQMSHFSAASLIFFLSLSFTLGDLLISLPQGLYIIKFTIHMHLFLYNLNHI